MAPENWSTRLRVKLRRNALQLRARWKRPAVLRAARAAAPGLFHVVVPPRVLDTFEEHLGRSGVASWTRPKGGYFITLDVMEGCARRVVALAKEAGVELTPAGAPYPYGKDPRDATIRIAPSFPELPEVAQAAEGVALCVLLAATEKLSGAAG